jgi:Concanavalin A-like lectin/glucanases superfamily
MLRWLMKQGKVIYQLEGEAKLPVRQWSTITVTADKQNVKLYLNGTLVDSLACPILPQRNRSVMKLGTYAFGHKFTFHGFMRNLKIAPQIIEPKKNITAKKLVLLESDFSKPGTTKAWKVIRGEWTRGARGYQELSDQKSADGCWTVLNKNGWNNYTFRTAITFYDNIGSVMLGFYRRDQKNMYLLELRRSEVGIVILKLSLVSNGTKKVLRSINSSIVKFPSIKSGKTVQLQVERYNNLIVASINSKPYFCVEDSALSSGGIALGTNGRKVAFSKLEVIQYPDYIAPIKPTKRKPLLLTITNPHYRHVFVRGEEITLKIAVVNNTESKIFTAAAALDITGVSSISRQLQFKNILSNSSSLQIITIKTANLHAGDYEIKLRSILNGRQLKQYYNITIVPQPRKDRFVYRSWNGNFTEDFIQQLSKNGFNGTGLTFGMHSDYNELIKPLAKYCDAALKYGVKIRIQFPSNGQVQTGRKDTQVLRQDGSRGPLPDPHHPDHQKWSIKRLHE